MNLAQIGRNSLAALVLLTGAGTAAAQTVQEFYTGKTLTLIVPFTAGGTNAAIGQAIAATMGKYIPGNPTLRVEYMPGAGGVTGMNYVYNRAERDGTVMLMPQDSVVVIQHTQPDAAEFAAQNYRWLGVVAQDHKVLAIRNDANVSSLDELKQRETHIGATAAGSETYFYARVAADFLGLKLNIIPGYPNSSSDMYLALEAGEIDGAVTGWTTLQRNANLMSKVKPYLVFGHGRVQQYPDVANLLELVKTDEERAIVRFLGSIGSIGRGVTMPPEVPADRLEALRAAFDQTMKDPLFVEAMEKIGVPLNPLSGEEAQKIVMEALDVTPAIIERVKESMSN